MVSGLMTLQYNSFEYYDAILIYLEVSATTNSHLIYEVYL